MTRRDALRSLTAVPATGLAAERQPDFIFIFSDDLGW